MNYEEIKSYNHVIDELQGENAKLRKLVEGLWFASQYLGMTPSGATGSGFARQMRELGICPSEISQQLTTDWIAEGVRNGWLYT